MMTNEMTRIMRPAVLVLVALSTILAGIGQASAQDDWEKPGVADGPVAEVTTIDLGEARPISMSPDGTLMVANGRSADGPTVCIYELPDAAERFCVELRSDDLMIPDIDPEGVSWSPDGRYVIFGSSAAKTFYDSDIQVLDVEEGAIANLTDDNYDGDILSFGDDVEARDDPIYADVFPAFSPDGSEIAFVRVPSTVKEIQGTQIVKMTFADGEASEPELVYEVDPNVGFAAYYRLEWSADGDDIYFTHVTNDKSDPRNGIWRVAADAEGDADEAEHITGLPDHPDAGYPVLSQLSPNGAQALIIYSGAFTYGIGSPAVGLLNLETGETEYLTVDLGDMADDVPEELAFVRWAGFSPDGESLIQIASEVAPNWITLRDVDSGAETIVDLSDYLERPGYPPTMWGGVQWLESGVVYIGQTPTAGLLVTLES